MRRTQTLQAALLAGVLVAALAAVGAAQSRSAEPLGGGRRIAEPPPAPPARPRVVGVKIYEHQGDRRRLFADFQDLGINTLFVSEALASDTEFRDLARQRGMALFVIQPVFYDPEALKKEPGLFAITNAGAAARDDWVALACPSRQEYRQRKAEAIARTVARLEPDGVSLDFIRFFAYWEMIRPERTYESIPNTCFCRTCLDRFSRETGVSLPGDLTTPQQAAAWIEARHLERWTDWKCRVIASMVEDIVRRVRAVRPGTRVNLHAVPWRRGDFGGALRKVVGQDLPALSRMTDYISPMCYSAMLQREPAWIASVVKDFSSQSTSPILPSIQVKEYYPGDTLLDPDGFEACLRSAIETPSAGVVFWSWALIEKAPQSRLIIKRNLSP